VKSYNFRDFVEEEKYKEIYYLFSRESILDGSVENYVENYLKKHDSYSRQAKLFPGGYKDVDEDFLEYIDDLRLTLAQEFYKTDHTLSPNQLVEATQKTIDRLVFTRFLEDKQIEVDDHIYHLENWQNFIELSRNLNGKYNGVVYKESFIDRNDFKGLDNLVFREICIDISSKESPYNFNAIPVHILGSIYERFLGKTILIEDGNVSIDLKDRVRKSGGVYYTPKYVVEYIVKNTIGKLIEDKTPKEIDKLSFGDISCGSGSFLIGVYEYLIDYHKEYYQTKLSDKTKIDARSEDFGNVEYVEGIWRLTLKRKQDILLNCIYGVDIDAQAVEVTQLSLFLKLLENESLASTERQLTVFSKVLPDLTGNILCGNSLVGWDVLAQKDLLPKKEVEVNPFDFRSSFNSVFKNNGFDALVGNPPYVKEYTDKESFEVVQKSYLKKYYQGKMDLWYFFVCNGIDLLKEGGLLGYIVPNNWPTNEGASIMRNKIVEDSRILSVDDFGSYQVFDDASIQTMILILAKSAKGSSYKLYHNKIVELQEGIKDAESLLLGIEKENIRRQNPSINRKDAKNKYIVFEGEQVVNELLEKILKQKNFSLNKREEVAQGIVPNPDEVSKRNIDKLEKKEEIEVGEGVFVIDKDKFSDQLTKEEQSFLKPTYEPNETERFILKTNTRDLIYSTVDNSIEQKDHTTLYNHLHRYKGIMEERRENEMGSREFYHLHWPRDEKFFKKGPKILAVRKCSGSPTFIYTEEEAYVMLSFNVIKSDRIDLKYLTGIYNSNLVEFWLSKKGKMQGNNYQVDKTPLLEIPIKTSSSGESVELINAVNQIILTKQNISNSTTSSDNDYYERKLSALMNDMNKVVYDIYELGPQEIAIVESNI
ncbi:MAG: N-6 DNA methylase, partial [Candidatus Paceibacterota bacterium]